ncbi:hypothetical protein D1871_19650 [Nakamurella silvestris]|nr:hypothetical protein D1871_19650 [Nakamurella silvestris]
MLEWRIRVPPSRLARWIAEHRRGLWITWIAVVAVDIVALFLMAVGGGGSTTTMVVVLLASLLVPVAVNGIRRAVLEYDTANDSAVPPM